MFFHPRTPTNERGVGWLMLDARTAFCSQYCVNFTPLTVRVRVTTWLIHFVSCRICVVCRVRSVSRGGESGPRLTCALGNSHRSVSGSVNFVQALNANCFAQADGNLSRRPSLSPSTSPAPSGSRTRCSICCVDQPSSCGSPPSTLPHDGLHPRDDRGPHRPTVHRPGPGARGHRV